MCENPAKMLGINDRKGAIEEGKQADICVFDPDWEETISQDSIKNKYPEVCIYKNKNLRGKIMNTYLKG